VLTSSERYIDCSIVEVACPFSEGGIPSRAEEAILVNLEESDPLTEVDLYSHSLNVRVTGVVLVDRPLD